MTAKMRLSLWAGFLVVATIFALANHGIKLAYFLVSLVLFVKI